MLGNTRPLEATVSSPAWWLFATPAVETVATGFPPRLSLPRNDAAPLAITRGSDGAPGFRNGSRKRCAQDRSRPRRRRPRCRGAHRRASASPTRYGPSPRASATAAGGTRSNSSPAKRRRRGQASEVADGIARQVQAGQVRRVFQSRQVGHTTRLGARSDPRKRM